MEWVQIDLLLQHSISKILVFGNYLFFIMMCVFLPQVVKKIFCLKGRFLGQYHLQRNYGYTTLVGDTRLTGGPQAIDESLHGTICHFMGMAYTIRMDNLHICDSGPIIGRYITIYRPPTEVAVIQIAEVYVWDQPQVADQSEYHGNFAI